MTNTTETYKPAYDSQTLLKEIEWFEIEVQRAESWEEYAEAKARIDIRVLKLFGTFE